MIHGKNGEGRFRAFALGEIVRWQTTYEESGDYYSYEIEGSTRAPGKFELSDCAKSTSRQSGTVVSIKNVFENQNGILLSPDFRDNVARIFAPYLVNYRDIKLVLDGKAIDTKEIVARKEEYQLDPISLQDGQKIEASLEIIEWRSISGRALYLCNEAGFALSERAPEIRAPGFNFGAYLKSRYFSDLDEGSLIDIDLAEGMGHLLNAARAKLNEYFKRREREKTEALIESWKAEGVYPYADKPSSVAEDRARQVFDICAVTVHDYVDGFENQSKTAKSLSFRLLKEAIETNSPELQKILAEVLALPREKRKEFSNLLDKTRLSDIIDTVKEVEHRIAVAAGLRGLVCRKDLKDSVKEREHIHRIVEANPWIFGDQYALGRSESGLTNMLREHLRHLKLDTRVLEPVLQSGARNGRVDVMLIKQVKLSGRTDDRHLVLELKRANKKLSVSDYNQILNYANSVINDDRFNKTEVSWDFWLVGTGADDAVEALCNAADRPAGCVHVFKSHQARIWVKTWGELLHDCLGRHEFIRSKLDLEADEDESVAYLKEVYFRVVKPTVAVAAE